MFVALGRISMYKQRLLACSLCLICLLAGCNKNKPASPAADNNRAPAKSAEAPGPAAPAAAPATEAEKPAAPPAAQQPPVVAERPPEPPPPPPPPVVIPAGTVLTVRLQQALGSKSSQEGQRFGASLAEPVVVKGKTLVPAGAMASGLVTDAKAAGRFKGGATLSLVLDGLVVRGTQYSIKTMAAAQNSKGKGKRTATMVGGGTGAGAVIGGIAGGGKGAAIGALVGAGAGTAGAGLTGGDRDITLPAEAVVSFQMTAPLTVKPSAVGASPSAHASPPSP